MILVKNSKFLLNLLFFEKGLDMCFYDAVYKKEGFLDYENAIFTESKNLHSFGQKFEISFESAFL